MGIFGPILGAGIGAIGSIIGGERANEANAQMARENREFQERMRNTEFQARVKDLEAAGLNPALAYEKGGASSPSGSMPAPQQNVLSDLSNSARTALELMNSTRLANAQTRNLESQAQAADTDAWLKRSLAAYQLPTAAAQAEITISDKRMREVLEKNYEAQIRASLEQIRAQIDQTRNNSALSAVQSELLRKSMPRANVNNRLWRLFDFGTGFLESNAKEAVGRKDEW